MLFLDEPCANLDGRSTREIETVLREVSAAGTSVIMTTHNLGQARRLASDVVFLLNGQIHETDLAHDIFNAPKSPEAKAFFKETSSNDPRPCFFSLSYRHRCTSAKSMKLAVTTSFHNSGCLTFLLPVLLEETGLEVQLLVVGTGQALRLGRAGDVDAILVHSRADEDAFVD